MEIETPFPIIKTKCYVPQVRRDRVKRDRLIHELNHGLQYPLILLTSLPGSGKTTALVEWASQLSLPVAWVSLDESDNDPAHFMRYFIAALQPIFPDARKIILNEFESLEPLPLETVLASVINEMVNKQRDFVLVLDDFHVIHSTPVQSFLASYLERQPPQAHLVIATRTDPRLPLPRLRSRNKVLELRIDHLRFTSAETEEYLNRVMDLRLSQEELTTLEARTEGWIASLQMAALSLQHAADPHSLVQSFSGSNRYIMDFLVEEVLNRQPAQVQDFLLQTSILDRLNGALCDAVYRMDAEAPGASSTGEIVVTAGQEMLEYLERSNLFILPLDEERNWYRYHHLFATLLRAKSARVNGIPASELHLRAADWFDRNGYPEEAIDHAIKAQDFHRAAALIERIAETVWLNGQYSRLSQWIQALPEHLVGSSPWLCVWNAWCYTQTGVLEGAISWIEKAETAARTQTLDISTSSPPSSASQSLNYHLTGLKVLTACLAQDFDRASLLAAWVMENPPPAGLRSAQMAQCHILHGLSYKYFIDGDLEKAERVNLDTVRISKGIGFTLRQLHGSNKLAYVYQVSGQLRRCFQFLQQALSDLESQELGGFFAAAALRFRLVELYSEWDRLEEAHQLVGEYLDPKTIADVPYLRVDAYNTYTRILLRRGDYLGAQNMLDKAHSLIQKSYIWPGLVWQTESLQVKLWLQSGDQNAAAAWTAGLPNDPSSLPAFSSESREISRARVLLAEAHYPEAIHLLDRLASSAIKGGRNGSLVEVHALQAAAFHQSGCLEPATTALEKAVSIAAPEGYCRIFTELGSPIAAVLTHILQQNHPPHLQYVRSLLEKFEADKETVSSSDRSGLAAVSGPSPVPLESSMVEPLSKRELEVLRCMAVGLSNAETAQKLVIEISTVKRHINNIFAKLGANNRVQALNIAKENKLL